MVAKFASWVRGLFYGRRDSRGASDNLADVMRRL
jgi:hypothetical protein